MARVLLVPAAVDCDPTEVGVPYVALTQAGHAVALATADARPPEADRAMLTGEGLRLWAPVLRADARGRAAWEALRASPAWAATRAVEAVRVDDFDAVVFPGGHAPPMRDYLESASVQALAAAAFAADRVVGAICHGAVVLARARTADGRSVLHGRKTTSLLRRQEMLAWRLTRGYLGDYYRTYPTPVEDEVRAALAAPEDFVAGPTPLLRDAPGKLGRGFVVQDGRYLSARWPGDAWRFSAALDAALRASPAG